MTGKPPTARSCGDPASGVNDVTGSLPAVDPPEDAHPLVRRASLQFEQEPASEPEATDRRRHPHPFDLRRTVAELQRTATDRVVVQVRDQHGAGGRRQLPVAGRDAAGDVESAVEADRQFGEVRPQARAGVRVPRIAGVDPDRRRRQEALDLGHRRDEAGALPTGQRAQDVRGQIAGAPVEHCPLGEADLGQTHRTGPQVGGTRFGDGQSLILQRSQQSAQAPGIEVQACPQGVEVRTVRPDLPQQACLPEGVVAVEVLIAECADALGDGPIEPAHLRDHRGLHSATTGR